VAIDELLRALAREAEAEVATLRASARAAADELDRASARRAADRAAAVLAEVRAARQRAADAAVATVARRRRGDVLRGRAAALDRVHAAVTAALPGLLVGPDGAAILAALTASVAAALVGGADDEPVELRCPPALIERVRAALGPRPGLTVIGDPAVATGVVARRADGQVTVDASLATCLDRWWPRLRVDVRPPDEAS